MCAWPAAVGPVCAFEPGRAFLRDSDPGQGNNNNNNNNSNTGAEPFWGSAPVSACGLASKERNAHAVRVARVTVGSLCGAGTQEGR